MSCGRCGKPGHYRPRCPENDARESRAGSAPAPIPARERGPWALAESDRALTGDAMTFTWEHAETGERVTATVPRPAGGWHESDEVCAVLRYPRDPVAYCARSMPSATVVRTAPAVAVPVVVARPAESTACGWGMW